MIHAIQVEQLRKIYSGVPAVDGVSFEVRKGEVFGLLGPNGAGKTTTVECIEGLRQPDSGTITVLGEKQTGDNQVLKRKTGIQLQTTGLFPLLTVTELLNLFRSFYEKTISTEELIRLVGLEEKRSTRSKNLSGGQLQRLSLALALVNDPELVFMDEPTTGLDPQARRQVWDVVQNMKQQGRTIMLTTHYMEEAQVLCDRVAVMNRGKIIALETPHNLITQHFETTAIEFEDRSQKSAAELEAMPGVQRVLQNGSQVTLFSVDVPQTIEGVLQQARAGTLVFDDLRVRSATLEDVFLKLTGRHIRD